MAGRGKIENKDKIPHKRVLKFTKEHTWTNATEPLHFNKPSLAGVGPGSSFGREMAAASPDVKIGLIPCAVGGTSLARWSRGGDLYQQALIRARMAMRDGTLKGILWHQGESDAGSEVKARTYADRLAKLVKDLRADLGQGDVPFVAGKLGEFLKSTTKSGNASYWPVVNEQIVRLPNLVPNAAVVESAGLEANSDSIHFNASSQRKLGKRYATAMKHLQLKATSQ